MRKRICLHLCISVFLVCAAAASALAAPKPKLVLTITIDQMRYDYLTRFRAEYKGGFDRLLTKGAVFTNASTSTSPPSPPSATARS